LEKSDAGLPKQLSCFGISDSFLVLNYKRRTFNV
jgi:hypothetical protein